MLLGRMIFCRDLQLEKALEPIEVTLVGMEMFTKLLQPENAYCPIDKRVVGSCIDSK